MRPAGTAMSTAAGMLQLSYSAARHRYTIRMESANSIGACAPERILLQRLPGPVVAKAVRQIVRHDRLHLLHRLPGALAGALLPVISTAG